MKNYCKLILAPIILFGSILMAQPVSFSSRGIWWWRSAICFIN